MPPRLPPLTDEELPDSVRPILERWPYRLHRTLAHAPDTLVAWLPWAEHVLLKNAMPARERELAILRVAVNARCDYEWGLHARLSRQLGVAEDDIARVPHGPDAAGWDADDAAILRAVDEMMADSRVSDATWAVLAARWSRQQLVDLLYVTGQFMTVALLLNSLGVQPEDGVPGLPAGFGRD